MQVNTLTDALAFIQRLAKDQADAHAELEANRDEANARATALAVVVRGQSEDLKASQDRVKELETDRRGARMAKAVRAWLQEQKAIQFVPWVLDPERPEYDPDKRALQKLRDGLLAGLAQVIRRASEPDRKETDG